MSSNFRNHAVSAILVLVGISTLSIAGAAQHTMVSTEQYAHAEKFMGYNTTPLVMNTARPTWLANDKFWYRTTRPSGAEFVLVDGATGHKEPAFDHTKLAAALSTAAGRPTDPTRLPFQTIEFSPDMQQVMFNLGPRRFSCDRAGSKCTEQPRAQGGGGGGGRGQGGPFAQRNDVPSPDGKRTVFIRDWNLWMRDVASGQETQLTKDGVKDYGYATDNAGWVKSDRPIVLWSPDSKKIATFQQDQRNVGDMYLVETKVGHPTLQAWKYPLPGDETVAMIERVIIDADSANMVRFKMPPDQHRSTLCDHIICRGSEWADVEWSPDAKTLAFVSTSRDHKKENLRIADAATGAIREVFEESSPTQFESGQGRVNWHYLPQSNEFLWYSERDNWGHLYLYDLATGKLKNQVTTGNWIVTQVLRVDEKARQIYFLADGKESGDPYFAHFYRVGFDGKGLTLLTPEDGNHEVLLSSDYKYFVDTYSKPDVAPVTVLREIGGKTIATIEKADISKLVASGWQPPQPIVLKARDGQTDIYGLLFKPTNLDPNKKYPIVNHIYPGPQGGSVGSRSFSASRGDAQSLAELGFVVVEIDGTGNPDRSKKFHDAYYGNLGDNTLPDQIAGMKQLAQKYPWIDLDRVGIYGHSGGGFATADAMFRYPDFFKVGISESGNHDNREYEDDWGERYHGLLTKTANGGTNYDDQANQNLAKNLKGHLLLAHGTIDENVPPYNTLLVVDALIKANKDFDLLMLPNQHHGYGSMSNYMTRRRWDYFVRYLRSEEPPKEYEMKPPALPGGGAPGGPEEEQP